MLACISRLEAGPRYLHSLSIPGETFELDGVRWRQWAMPARPARPKTESFLPTVSARAGHSDTYRLEFFNT